MADINNTEKHWLIAFYGRVSTSLQEEQKTIETQLMAMNDFADKKFGKGNYTVVKEYLDEGWSGDNIVRPSLDQLRVDAKKKIWDAVIIYDPDRLARRYSLQELVMDEIKDVGIEVIFVTVSTPKNIEDKILYGVRGLFAEYERAKISERFRLGKLLKVRNGNILTTEALYGYDYIRNDKINKKPGYYVINEEEARVVRMIFAWVGEEGLTLRQVVRRLQEMEIKPRKSKRGVWNTSTLSTLLRHKAYIGMAHWGSSYAVVPKNPTNKEKYRQVKKSSRKIKPETEWIASNIPVPPIIGEELFMKVREQLKTNFALCQRNTKNEYLLGGKIFCSCDTKRCGEGPQHGKHLYYRCSNRIYNFPLSPTCNEKGINARIADKLVWQKIKEFMTSPKLLSRQINRRKDIRKNKTLPLIENIGIAEKELAKLKAQEDRYIKAYGNGALTIEQLKEQVTSIKSHMATFESQIRKVNQEKSRIDTAPTPTEKEIKIFTDEAAKTINDLNFETKRTIIRNTVGRIIGTQRQLQVSGEIPLTLNYVTYKTNYRYSWPA